MPRHGVRWKRLDYLFFTGDLICIQYLHHVLYIWRFVGNWGQLLVLFWAARPEVLL